MHKTKLVICAMVILLITYVTSLNYGGCIDLSDQGNNSSGSSTPPATDAPSVTTLPAGDITIDSATLNGIVNPNGLETSASFQWGTSVGYGSITPAQSVGNGNSSLNVVATVNGLTFGATYYFRLRASNSRGITYSSGFSFTTLLPTAPPLQVSSPNPADGASGVSILNAQLFWVAATYATSYDVYFGTTTSPTYKTNVTATNYTPTDTLGYNIRYYWRIDAKNTVGTTTGNLWNFTIQGPQPPVVETYAASNVLTDTAILNGAINPMALTTTAYFEWGVAPDYTNTVTPLPIPIGSGLSNVNVYANLGPISPATTFNFRLRASNAPYGGGVTYGTSQTFTTTALPPPSCTTNAADNITSNSARLNGTVNPNGLSTNVYFQWGWNISYGNTTNLQNIGSGTTNVNVAASLGGLSAITQYNFRVVATNSSGTTYGNNLTFNTGAPSGSAPTCTTNPAGNIASTSAILNGTVNPNGVATTAYFNYGLTTSYTFTTTYQAIGTGTNNINVTATITGLSANTTYNFRVVGTSSAGTTYGNNLTFTTTTGSGTVNRPLSSDTIPSFTSPQSPVQAYGYRFTPTASGQVTALGRYIGSGTGNTTVRLWNDSGTQLSSVNVSSASGWQWANITPVSISTGNYYRVAVDCSNVWYSGSGAFAFPAQRGNITITGCCYSYSVASPYGPFPSLTAGLDTTVMYGWADIEFTTN